MTHGSSGTVTLSRDSPGGGFTGTVAMACTSPVNYVTCSVSQASVPVTGTTTVNL